MSTELLRAGVRAPKTLAFGVVPCAALLAGVGLVASRGANPVQTTLAPEAKVEARTARPSGVETRSGGALVIAGGGHLPQPIRERFCALAGGPKARIVVIPTATSSADRATYLASLLDDWNSSAVASVQLLHTRSRDEANDPSFVRPLEEATGVWLGGGDQSFLTEAYLGTAVEARLKALLARGGVIGGTSAGAAVMSGVMIAGGLTKADVSRGFDFLAGAVIDQHFLKRNRVERLVGVLSEHPDLVGLGIDEQTALVVDVRDHRLSVIGDSYVVACVPDSQHKSVRLKFLKSGDQTDLADLKVPSAAPVPVLGLGSL